jgi:hypothetical protein
MNYAKLQERDRRSADRRRGDRRYDRAPGTQWLLILGIAAAVVEIARVLVAIFIELRAHAHFV